MRRVGSLGTVAFGLLVAGCMPPDSEGSGGGTGADGSDGSGTSDVPGCGGEEGFAGGAGSMTPEGVVIPIANRIDILFVIDNSGSMATSQTILARSTDLLVTMLEDEEVAADYRIAVTTTDNGNPWCDEDSPEAGDLVMSSCLERREDFSVGSLDLLEIGCRDQCALESLEILPTPLVPGGESVARPWLEGGVGRINVGNATAVEALRCAVPQGVAGCGFGQPLERMFQALSDMGDPDSPSFGFLRDDAELAIVILADGADCSYADESIFSPEGDRTFWSDRNAQAPTAAACWRAGVACDGGACASADRDALGTRVHPDAAVMHPVSRYVDALKALEATKHVIAPDKRVRVRVISGADPEGFVSYPPPRDPVQDASFGIGFGCTSPQASAISPVRMREVAEAMALGTEEVLFSICEGSYIAARGDVAQSVAQNSICYPSCVSDSDPTTPELDANCTMTLAVPHDEGTVAVNVPQCDGEGDLPPDALHCFIPAGTPTLGACSGLGTNLQLSFRHLPGNPFPAGARVLASCQPSETPAFDCPSYQ